VDRWRWCVDPAPAGSGGRVFGLALERGGNAASRSCSAIQRAGSVVHVCGVAAVARESQAVGPVCEYVSGVGKALRRRRSGETVSVLRRDVGILSCMPEEEWWCRRCDEGVERGGASKLGGCVIAQENFARGPVGLCLHRGDRVAEDGEADLCAAAPFARRGRRLPPADRGFASGACHVGGLFRLYPERHMARTRGSSKPGLTVLVGESRWLYARPHFELREICRTWLLTVWGDEKPPRGDVPIRRTRCDQACACKLGAGHRCPSGVGRVVGPTIRRRIPAHGVASVSGHPIESCGALAGR
jgi:hypothetical protein